MSMCDNRGLSPVVSRRPDEEVEAPAAVLRVRDAQVDRSEERIGREIGAERALPSGERSFGEELVHLGELGRDAEVNCPVANLNDEPTDDIGVDLGYC